MKVKFPVSTRSRGFLKSNVALYKRSKWPDLQSGSYDSRVRIPHAIQSNSVRNPKAQRSHDWSVIKYEFQLRF